MCAITDVLSFGVKVSHENHSALYSYIYTLSVYNIQLVWPLDQTLPIKYKEFLQFIVIILSRALELNFFQPSCVDTGHPIFSIVNTVEECLNCKYISTISKTPAMIRPSKMWGALSSCSLLLGFESSVVLLGLWVSVFQFRTNSHADYCGGNLEIPYYTKVILRNLIFFVLYCDDMFEILIHKCPMIPLVAKGRYFVLLYMYTQWLGPTLWILNGLWPIWLVCSIRLNDY